MVLYLYVTLDRWMTAPMTRVYLQGHHFAQLQHMPVAAKTHSRQLTEANVVAGGMQIIFAETAEPPHMISELKDFLSTLGKLNPVDVVMVAKLMKVRSYSTGEFLTQTGHSTELFAILKGMTRNYIILPNGEEKTMRLNNEGTVTASPTVFTDDETAPEIIVALENCLIASLDVRELEKLADHRPNVMAMFASELKKAITESREQVWFHTVLTPEDRYLYIRERYPQLLQRVQIKYLASYIGITPVSLSRIRARLVKPGK